MSDHDEDLVRLCLGGDKLLWPVWWGCSG